MRALGAASEQFQCLLLVYRVIRAIFTIAKRIKAIVKRSFSALPSLSAPRMEAIFQLFSVERLHQRARSPDHLFDIFGFLMRRLRKTVKQKLEKRKTKNAERGERRTGRRRSTDGVSISPSSRDRCAFASISIIINASHALIANNNNN